jgi:hypothetical protein
VACYSSNYGEFGGDPEIALTAAILGTESGESTGAFASVCMVFRPPLTAPNSVQFIVYGPDGTLLNEAPLDTKGDNPSIPQNCIGCHGIKATYDASTNAVNGARFLPFDPGAFRFSEQAGYTRADQEENIRALNDAIRSAALSAAALEFVEGLYAGDPTVEGTVADESFVPRGWRNTARDAAVYRNAIGPYCRACHGSHDADRGLDFASADATRDLWGGTLGPLLCGDSHGMPNAEQVMKRFWASPARAYLASHYNFAGACAP